VSLPSNDSGIAIFDSIGLFDLPDGALFQVFRETDAVLAGFITVLL
jgi:hypothetical protein